MLSLFNHLFDFFHHQPINCLSIASGFNRRAQIFYYKIQLINNKNNFKNRNINKKQPVSRNNFQ